MMLKLFLITLLCTTLVFANQPVHNFQDASWKSVSGFVSKGHLDHGSLVKQLACHREGGGDEGGDEDGDEGDGAGEDQMNMKARMNMNTKAKGK